MRGEKLQKCVALFYKTFFVAVVVVLCHYIFVNIPKTQQLCNLHLNAFTAKVTRFHIWSSLFIATDFTEMGNENQFLPVPLISVICACNASFSMRVYYVICLCMYVRVCTRVCVSAKSTKACHKLFPCSRET